MPEYNQKIVLSTNYVHTGCHRVKTSNGKYNLDCGGNYIISSTQNFVRSRSCATLLDCFLPKQVDVLLYLPGQDGGILQLVIVKVIRFVCFLYYTLWPGGNQHSKHLSITVFLCNLFRCIAKFFIPTKYRVQSHCHSNFKMFDFKWQLDISIELSIK